jgi:hypothetical protein
MEPCFVFSWCAADVVGEPVLEPFFGWDTIFDVVDNLRR